MKEKLLGVKYIFLDEVSMLSCHDMYKISAQLAKAFNNCDLTFGGVNMIFAGDFAQLPPVLGGESHALYSGIIGNRVYSSLTHYDQESAIGKALWHQITMPSSALKLASTFSFGIFPGRDCRRWFARLGNRTKMILSQSPKRRKVRSPYDLPVHSQHPKMQSLTTSSHIASSCMPRTFSSRP